MCSNLVLNIIFVFFIYTISFQYLFTKYIFSHRTQKCNDDEWADMTGSFSSWMDANMNVPRASLTKLPPKAKKLALEDGSAAGGSGGGSRSSAQEVFTELAVAPSGKKQDKHKEFLAAAKKVQNKVTGIVSKLQSTKKEVKKTEYSAGLLKKLDNLADQQAQELLKVAAAFPADKTATVAGMKSWLHDAAKWHIEVHKVQTACKAFT